jgi:hypothetical protein
MIGIYHNEVKTSSHVTGRAAQACTMLDKEGAVR